MKKITNVFQPLFREHGYTKGILFLGFSFVILAISIFYFVASIGKPIMGVEISLVNNEWSVRSVDSNGAAGLAGIRSGDIPVMINGEPAQVFLENYKNINAISGLLITEITVTDTDGQIKRASLDGAVPTPNSNIEFVSLVLVSIIFWATGFYTFFKRPGNPAAFIFCLSALVFGLLVATTIGRECLIPGALWIVSALMILGPWLLLHFFLVLPEERKWGKNNRTIWLIYIIPVITIVLLLMMGTSYGQMVPWFYALRAIDNVLAVLGIIVIGVVNYVTASSIRTRQQMKVILLSSVAALVPFLIFFTIPILIWKQTILPPGISVLFLVFLPVGMAYAIVKQKLMDIDVIIRRSVVYGLVTILMVAILSSFIFFLLRVVDPLGEPAKFLIALLTGVIAVVLIGPLKNRVELFVDRLFYKDRYDYRQIIQGLNTSLNTLRESYEMSRLIVGTAVNALNLAGGCLLIKNNFDELEISVTHGIYNDTAKRDEIRQICLERKKEDEFPNPLSSICPETAFLIPLMAAEREVGILCISNKVSRQDFSSDDLLLLDGIGSAAALSLHRAMLIREVSVRDTFVSIASHELRTPLTVVLGYAELLLHRNPPEETRKHWLKLILDGGTRLSSIVDDLLNVTRIQSGRITFKQDKVNVPELLEERLSFMRETTENHQFLLNTQPVLPLIKADKEKLGQIIDNLLSNAVKYSPQGGEIIVAAHHDLDSRRVIISITDEGMGISREDKNLLFTTFHRINRPETRTIPGTGLGLYIAKEWTEAMGGRIWVESELNKGSTFFLDFPLKGTGKNNSTFG